MSNLILIILIICFGFTSYSQQDKIEQLQNDVNYLASDELKGRETGTEGEKLAASYIIGEFEKIGVEPKGSDGYNQSFDITPKANPHQKEGEFTGEPIKVTNVIGYIDNGAEKTVVIGAHYDHLGLGGEGSLHAGEDEIHNGADDNASGVAIMLQLARDLVKENEPKQNFLFIAFSGEEKGLWGSNYYCKNPTIDLSTVNFMINMDMVGRLDSDKGLAINGVGTSPAWERVLTTTSLNEAKLVTSESGVGPSDHTSFYLKDIPVLHFFTGQHSDYHKPSDDIDLINFEGMARINEYILEIINYLGEEEKIAFTKTKDESEDTPRFTVTLGVMPDYMFQGDGMRIDGVTEGKPASKAGFEAGDVVIKMGDIEVTDMMSYMKALSEFKKGDKTTVIVKRGKKKIKEKVTF